MGHISWSDETVIGGQWDWDYMQLAYGCKAGLSVYRPSWSDAEMALIDQRIDDGNLTTGSFRRRTNGYIYIIEK